MNRWLPLSTIAALLAASAAAHAAPAQLHEMGSIASVDDARGVPTFVWASPQHQPVAAPTVPRQPEPMARWYLEQYAPLYALSDEALRNTHVSHVHDIGRGGIIVTFRQRVNGVEVIRNEVKLLMRRNLQLVAIGGNLHSAAISIPGRHGRTFKLTAEQALAAAVADRTGVAIAPKSLQDTGAPRGDYRYFTRPAGAFGADGWRLAQPTRIKRVLYPVADGLIAAYFTEIDVSRKGAVTSDYYAYVVAADDGRILWSRDLTESDSFAYTVWADTDGLNTPLDGPQANATPHPTGMPDGFEPAFIPPSVISIEGFNTNPQGAADPWLPAGATETTGNNVEAYADILDPDGFGPGDLRAETTGPSAFGWLYDTLLPPLDNEAQSKAAIVQLFYTTNWLHDYFYDSGFDEEAGNAQESNFGRGGEEADSMKAEAQDGALEGNRNNANMSTPADGSRPRMQMFLWRGPELIRRLDALGSTLDSGTAAFGPTDFNITGQLVLADDGTDDVTDACDPILNDVTGGIALIRRGGCTFASKVQNAQDNGAIAAIIANNQPMAGPMAMGGSGPDVTIPVMSVSTADGDALELALQMAPETVTLERAVDIERDGTIDNNIIAHEWGHYIHHRLVDVGSRQGSAMSEGWGDFMALHTTAREGDDFTGAYAMSIYATATLGDSAYFGIRRVPYSVDVTKNALSFRHISEGEPLPDTHPIAGGSSSNAEVHNAGEIWATMMWEAYVALLGETAGPSPRYTFEEARRVMADYVVAGMKLTPVDATFTEQRDAILAAALAGDRRDFDLLAAAFARRGAGSCADAPERFSTDFVGVVEAFEVAGRIQITGLSLSDSLLSCDLDGVLDAQERGEIIVELRNSGLFELTDTGLEISSPTPGVTVENPALSFGTLAPLATTLVPVEVTLDAAVVGQQSIQLDVVASNSVACEPVVASALIERGNIDVRASVSTVDDAETGIVAWGETTESGTSGIWSIETDTVELDNNVWRGIDFGAPSDVSLESPVIEVDPTAPFVISFQHRHDFEFSDNTNWDGGVIEISRDGGSVWEDISIYADPGYGGPITDQSGNPLALRDAFVSQNAAFPAMEPMTLNLGTQFAGETVKFRFRIGTDAAVGAPGWEVDDISVTGVTNTPFPAILDDGNDCSGVPFADAGPDQTVDGGVLVALDATASSDPQGDALTFEWTQIAGPEVSLASANSPTPQFVSPAVAQDTPIALRVRVTDGTGLATDTAVITVRAGGDGDAGPGADAGDGPDAGDPGEDSGGCCSAGGSPLDHMPAAILLAFGLVFVLRRRQTAA